MKPNTPDNIWARIEKSNGCHLWTAQLNTDGYGKLKYRNKTMSAHRWVWEQVNGTPEKGLIVRHTCDNRACCNIEHLELGTPADNSNDMVVRGRSLKGSASPRALLNPAIAEIIRYAHEVCGVNQELLSNCFGVSRGCVYYAFTRQTWGIQHEPVG